MAHCPADDDDDALDETEYPDESDQDDGPDLDDTVPCPRCGLQIHEQAQVCPYCRTFVTSGTAAPMPRWIRLGMWLLIIILAMALLGWLGGLWPF